MFWFSRLYSYILRCISRVNRRKVDIHATTSYSDMPYEKFHAWENYGMKIHEKEDFAPKSFLG